MVVDGNKITSDFFSFCFHFLLGQMDDSGESNVHTYKHHIKAYRGGHL